MPTFPRSRDQHQWSAGERVPKAVLDGLPGSWLGEDLQSHSGITSETTVAAETVDYNDSRRLEIVVFGQYKITNSGAQIIGNIKFGGSTIRQGLRRVAGAANEQQDFMCCGVVFPGAAGTATAAFTLQLGAGAGSVEGIDVQLAVYDTGPAS